MSERKTGRVLGFIFAGYVLLASQSPYSIIVYSVANFIDPILVTFGQICNFRYPNLVTFFLSICLMMNEEYSTSHLQSKNQKMCVPILVIVLKM